MAKHEPLTPLPRADYLPGQRFVLAVSAVFVIGAAALGIPWWVTLIQCASTWIMLSRERYYGDWGGFRPRREGSRDEG